jgi:predicted Fe-Mo cluster-binding NifX family protein
MDGTCLAPTSAGPAEHWINDSIDERKKTMKITITAEQPRLDSAVDSRFGRCRYFIVTDTDTREWEAVENRDAALSSGAGIGAAQWVVSHGAKAVITGVVGPKASQVLNAAGIPIVSVPGGTVLQAIEDFKAGRIGSGSQAVANPSTGSWGRGQGRGGCGRGMGGGTGRGTGAGMGRGKGRGNG